LASAKRTRLMGWRWSVGLDTRSSGS
jgi:hypothetical protein